MRPFIFDLLFHDDRMFVLEVTPVEAGDNTSVVLAPELSSTKTREWAVVTRKNVPGFPPHRVDRFPTQAEAIDFYKRTVISTPRKSLGEKSPEPVPTLQQYTAWLVQENLFDPILNGNGRRTDA
ncbi:MAG: hypothetical protein WAV67_07785 [Dokdonella sp.]